MSTKKKLNYKERQKLQDKKKNGLIAKIAAAFFIAVTAFYPLFIDIRSPVFNSEGEITRATKYLQLTTDKAYFFWLMAGVFLAALLVMLIVLGKLSGIDDYYADDEPTRLFSAAEWSLLAFIVLTFASAFAASFNTDIVQNSHATKMVKDYVWLGYESRFEGFISFFFYAFSFFIIARFYKPKRLHFLLIAGSACVVSLIGVLQFFGHDFLNLFPFDFGGDLADEYGNPLYGPLSAFFRTTLGNVNIVSAYCSFTILLFTGLYAGSRSRWQYLYLGAGIISFALSLTTGNSGDAHKVAILGAMVLLVPYWISDRERLAKVLIMLSGWCAVYAGHSAYLSALKNEYESGAIFAPSDTWFLYGYSHKNIALFIILAVVLLAGGLSLLLLLKKWPERVLKKAGIIFLPVMIIGGLIGLEIIGSRLADNPNNIIWQAREMMHGRFNDEFGSGRGWIWKQAVSVIPENPILGTGPDTFYYALGTERQAEAHELFRTVFDKAHNIFLQIAVCMGVPALLAFLMFLGSVFVPAVKRAFERPLLLAFGAAALSYTIQALFCVEVPITTPLWWVALGVMACEVWQAKAGCEPVEL